MNSKINYALEEYKMLKDEVKTFTNQTFRDFQLFIAIIAIFFTLIGSKDNGFSKFGNYAFMQFAVFIFIIIQFNRIIYLLIVRKHLANLEVKLNSDFDKNHWFQWESEIVPSKISPLNSYSSISQIFIGSMYLIILAVLIYQSLEHYSDFESRDKKFILLFYCILLVFEVAFILFSLVNFQKHIDKKSNKA